MSTAVADDLRDGEHADHHRYHADAAEELDAAEGEARNRRRIVEPGRTHASDVRRAHDVYQRVGASTDVVRKEMCCVFEDRGGADAGAAAAEGRRRRRGRAFVQHHRQTPWKVCTRPNFRYERPWAGHYRQHHQLGIEVLGPDVPDIDVEVISLAYDLYRGIGLTKFTLLLNSLGDATCRPGVQPERSSTTSRRAGRAVRRHTGDRAAENPMRVAPTAKRKACIATRPAAHRASPITCARSARPTSTRAGGASARSRSTSSSSRVSCAASTTTHATTFEFQSS